MIEQIRNITVVLIESGLQSGCGAETQCNGRNRDFGAKAPSNAKSALSSQSSFFKIKQRGSASLRRSSIFMTPDCEL